MSYATAATAFCRNQRSRSPRYSFSLTGPAATTPLTTTTDTSLAADLRRQKEAIGLLTSAIAIDLAQPHRTTIGILSAKGESSSPNS